MKIYKSRNVKTPERGTPGSAGLDFFVPNDFSIGEFIIPEHGSVNIPSGIHAKVPEGYALIAFNKSGVALKKKLVVGACVIDEDYQGEIHLHVINTGMYPVLLKPGDKLVQFVCLPVEYVSVEVCDDLSEVFDEKTERGTGGFGSTGK